MTKSKGILGPRHAWQESELAMIRAEYPHKPTAEIAAALGLSEQKIYQRANALGLKKTAEYLASPAAGRTNGRQGLGTRFDKGSMPWNKGMKGLQIGGVETQFKPGKMPHNTRPVGSHRLDMHGYLQRKIGEGKGSNSVRWRAVHELVWTEANGPVPPKHIVVFRPGMRTAELDQITLNLVECISLAENMRRNTVHNMPKELAELVQLRGAINRQINKRTKS